MWRSSTSEQPKDHVSISCKVCWSLTPSFSANSIASHAAILCTPTSNWFTYRVSTYHLLITLPSWVQQHEKHGVGWTLGTSLPVCYDNAPSPSLSHTP